MAQKSREPGWGPGRGPDSCLLSGPHDSQVPGNPQVRLRADVRFRTLTNRLWHLGPRPAAELLLEVTAGRDLVEALEEYADRSDHGRRARRSQLAGAAVEAVA